MLKTAFILFLLLASGCKDQYTPKPYGYFRIDFPEKQLHTRIFKILTRHVFLHRHRPSWKPIPISRQNQGG